MGIVIWYKSHVRESDDAFNDGALDHISHAILVHPVFCVIDCLVAVTNLELFDLEPGGSKSASLANAEVIKHGASLNCVHALQKDLVIFQVFDGKSHGEGYAQGKSFRNGNHEKYHSNYKHFSEFNDDGVERKWLTAEEGPDQGKEQESGDNREAGCELREFAYLVGSSFKSRLKKCLLLFLLEVFRLSGLSQKSVFSDAANKSFSRPTHDFGVRE